MDTNDPTQFSEWLANLKGGVVDDELTLQLRSLVQEVFEIGKAGELTFSIRLTKDDARTLTLAEKVTAKHPVEPRAKSLWFPDENGELHRDDPYQKRLPLRDPSNS